MIDEKLLRLLLEKKTLRGSTGTLSLTDSTICFTPNEPGKQTVQRSLVYVKST